MSITIRSMGISVNCVFNKLGNWCSHKNQRKIFIIFGSKLCKKFPDNGNRDLCMNYPYSSCFPKCPPSKK
jgi:hypothetical protein